MKILLTGANGYIGRRLKRRLSESDDVSLRLFVRSKKSLSENTLESSEIVVGDTFDRVALRQALEGVDVAYYLIHSLQVENYREKDRESAQNFVDIAAECGVKRIIYLGGLGEKESASEHLLSRIETGEVLSSKPELSCLWFRAGIIIGSGSASFEIVRNLVQKLPVMITPKWVDTKAEPIGVDDVIEYLYRAKDIESNESKIIDIGCGEMRYRDMMLATAEVMGLKRFLIPVPLLTPKLSSYWLTLFTPVPYSVASSLIEGLKSEVVRKNSVADELFDIKPMEYQACVKKALEEIEKNQVISRWSDSAAGDVWDRDHQQDIANALFIHRESVDAKNIEPKKIYASLLSLGGRSGWFRYDFLWEIRGVVDKLFGGFGTNRGRRDEKMLRIGDSLDFWKVVELEENRRILLYAQMKLPGKAWLEFLLEDGKIIQSAYFYPNGLLGRIYWYLLVPIHNLIFKDMIRQIVYRSISI